MALIAPSFTAKIAGEEIELVFDFESIFRLEKATGKSAMAAIMDNDIMALTWTVPALSALLKKNPPATVLLLKKATARERMDLNQVIVKGISAFYAPEVEEDEEEKKDSAAG